MGIDRLTVGPPQVDGVGDEIAGIAGGSEDQIELTGIDFEDTGRSENRIGTHVMIGRSDCLLASSQTAAGERTHLHFRLGVKGDSQRLRLGLRGRVDRSQVVEYGVGFGHFF